MEGLSRPLRALSIVTACLLASCDTVSTTKLSGIWSTCSEPWEVEKADAAADRADWAAWLTMNCGLFGNRGTPVRVIRYATDVTPARMKHNFAPVPQDDSLPDQVCEVEVYYQEGGTGIGYTNFLNIEKSP